jgi:catechol 2,3-dioxygenase-like lactoylglutathione lyase family enzyme
MTKENKIRFRTDGNFAIHVNDLVKAEAFYSGVLGFRLLNKTVNRLDYDTGIVKLFIVKDDALIAFIPALEVENYQEAKKHVTDNGCKILKEFGDTAFYFADPFNFVIDVIVRRTSSHD